MRDSVSFKYLKLKILIQLGLKALVAINLQLVLNTDHVQKVISTLDLLVELHKYKV